MAGFMESDSIDNTSKVGMVLSTVVAGAALIMGAIYKDECPAERYIPIYLIVFGVMVILSILIRLMIFKCQDYCYRGYICYGILLVLSLFTFAWFIAGNVWIYRLYNHYDGTDNKAANYCNGQFYLFAFWLLNTNYILLGLIILISCCCCRKK